MTTTVDQCVRRVSGYRQAHKTRDVPTKQTFYSYLRCWLIWLLSPDFESDKQLQKIPSFKCRTRDEPRCSSTDMNCRADGRAGVEPMPIRSTKRQDLNLWAQTRFKTNLMFFSKLKFKSIEISLTSESVKSAFICCNYAKNFPTIFWDALYSKYKASINIWSINILAHLCTYN